MKRIAKFVVVATTALTLVAFLGAAPSYADGVGSINGPSITDLPATCVPIPFGQQITSKAEMFFTNAVEFGATAVCNSVPSINNITATLKLGNNLIETCTLWTNFLNYVGTTTICSRGDLTPGVYTVTGTVYFSAYNKNAQSDVTWVVPVASQ